MTSSVDPTVECAAIFARLRALGDPIYEGVDQNTVLEKTPFGKNVPYRDFQPGNTIPAAGQRMLSAPEQSQPHIWAFQISHVAPTRAAARALAVATDVSLIGWEPSNNASSITTFYFNTYDEFAKNGENVQWIATHFYETTLGMNPDPSTNLVTDPGYGAGGYGE